jgi:hypothetical protein
MRSASFRYSGLAAACVATLFSVSASAQDAADPVVDEAAKAAEPAPAAAPAAAPAPAADEGDKDGVRFRGGVSGGVGAEFVSSATAIMGGVDGRMGVQINDMIGVYAQPHLSFGSFGSGVGGFAALTGTFTGTAVVDFTFLDQIFVGGGAGFGVFNNPTGPVVHLRAGGYPLMGHGENGIRRKGLMLGVDLRLGFITGATVVYPMGSIGYEAF